MPKAEFGSVKHLNKQMKIKGLTRLRWYCQICERALRDENAFKQHTLSESHVRNMLAVGSDPRKVINEFSNQFLKEFIQLLRTGHGEKQVHINQFYQEYIQRRDHVHMNSTKWSSLSEFAKHLGREGICRVEENDKGLFISWIDSSPEALKRQEALRRKEAQDRGDEEWEQRLLQAQIERANKTAKERKRAEGGDKGDKGDEGDEDDEDDEDKEDKYLLQREEGQKVKLSFGSLAKSAAAPAPAESTAPTATTGRAEDTPEPTTRTSADTAAAGEAKEPDETQEASPAPAAAEPAPAGPVGPAVAKPTPFKFGGLAKPQAKNVFAAAKKNALGGGGAPKKIEVQKKMSEAERIMKEELERNKRGRDSSGKGGGMSFSFGQPASKKPRF